MGEGGSLQTLLDYFSCHPQTWHVIHVLETGLFFLKGSEEVEVKKNLGCEDFMMRGFRKLPLYYYKLYKVQGTDRTPNVAAASVRSGISCAMMGEMTISLRKGRAGPGRAWPGLGGSFDSGSVRRPEFLTNLLPIGQAETVLRTDLV